MLPGKRFMRPDPKPTSWLFRVVLIKIGILSWPRGHIGTGSKRQVGGSWGLIMRYRPSFNGAQKSKIQGPMHKDAESEALNYQTRQ
ncbi:hypothetical protein NDU88_003482 [Pleurodeles waltl]|uniref:Uncharacterized protein n=1 Tax=Pleurodeles waltl TaxID=8319 RepID=A0AAV7RGC6_PLEWA|nr:hypothetical protein NDU88_003482 [Pleurodeles waltl]